MPGLSTGEANPPTSSTPVSPAFTSPTSTVRHQTGPVVPVVTSPALGLPVTSRSTDGLTRTNLTSLPPHFSGPPNGSPGPSSSSRSKPSSLLMRSGQRPAPTGTALSSTASGPALPSASHKGHILVSTAPAPERPTAPQVSPVHSPSSFRVSPQTIPLSASSDRETPNMSPLNGTSGTYPGRVPAAFVTPTNSGSSRTPSGPSAPSAPPLPPASPGGCVSSSSASGSSGSGPSFALGSPQLVFGSWPSWRVRQAPDSCHPVRLLTLLERPG